MDMPWLAYYELGVPHVIPPLAYSSLADFCEKICYRYADKPAFTNFDCTLTYRQLGYYSQAVAAFLLNEYKLLPGDRVAIMMPNLLQYPVSMLGILRAGLVVVNVNPQYTRHELHHQLTDSGAKVIIAWDGAANVIQQTLAEMKEPPKVIITHLGDLMPKLKGKLFQLALYLTRKISRWKINDVWFFNDVLAYGKHQRLPVVTSTLEDIAFLQYTGGTTGVPKGAMLTHQNILSNISQAVEWVDHVLIPGAGDVAISPLPFYHIFSLLANCFLFMALGGHDVLVTNPRDIKKLLHLLTKQPFQFISGVNTLFSAMLVHPEINNVDFSHMKVALAGGMALQRVVAEKWFAMTGKCLLEGYGLTETSPAVTIMPALTQKYLGSCGLPIPSTEVQVRDENGQVLGINEAGELYVKGPQVMKGYWQQPEETAKVLSTDGWLRTGDVAKIDAQGFVYLLDRIKDMILVSGFNVYPNEIEDEVAKCPGVLEVAAVGIPDEHSGEAVKLFVVKKDPALTVEMLMAFCHEHLTGYKRPKEIEFREHLPKSNVGKVLRRALKG